MKPTQSCETPAPEAQQDRDKCLDSDWELVNGFQELDFSRRKLPGYVQTASNDRDGEAWECDSDATLPFDSGSPGDLDSDASEEVDDGIPAAHECSLSSGILNEPYELTTAKVPATFHPGHNSITIVVDGEHGIRSQDVDSKGLDEALQKLKEDNCFIEFESHIRKVRYSVTRTTGKVEEDQKCVTWHEARSWLVQELGASPFTKANVYVCTGLKLETEFGQQFRRLFLFFFLWGLAWHHPLMELCR